MAVFNPLAGYARIKVVRSFDELIHTPLADGVNGLCWQRELPGDFGEIVKKFDTDDEITVLDESRLRKLSLTHAGKAAAGAMLADQQLLADLGLSPVLECVREYARDEHAIVPTDVYSFHVDRAPVAIDTYLCTYFGPPSEGLRNDHARRRVDTAATRAQLLKEYGGKDDDGFVEFLCENNFDLHYAAAENAQPFSFGLGNLWRVAVEYPGSPVPPFIHRAPETKQPRLILIS